MNVRLRLIASLLALAAGAAAVAVAVDVLRSALA
jgi:hypothetical protein